MSDVLVITDQERIARIFHKAGERASYRLRVVSTLSQAEEEVAASMPSRAFVQGNISGLSGDEVLRHLRRLLPGDVTVTLLAGEGEPPAADGDEALDLAAPDGMLEAAVLRLVSSGEPPRTAPTQARPASAAPAATAAAAGDLLFAAVHDPVDGDRRTTKMKFFCALFLVLSGVALGGAAYHFSGAADSSPAAVAPPEKVSAAAPEPAAPRAVAQPVSHPAVALTEYLVQPGDNMRKILSQHFGITDTAGSPLMSEIKRLNNLQELRRLHPGQKLLLPVAAKDK